MDEPNCRRLHTLRRRADLTNRMRNFFASERFWEVETPLWSRDTCVDTWIDPVACDLPGIGGGFLQTSPEFHMKRMLSAGADRIYQLTRSFRAGEAGRMHNPEFAILEWYAVGEDHRDAMARTDRLVRAVMPSALSADPIPAVRYYDAMAEAVGTRVESLDDQELSSLATDFGFAPHDTDTRDDVLNYLLAVAIEPRLAEKPAVFLTEYPASQAALSVIRDGRLPVAERFELYLRGVEVANGYHELTDADELRRRFVIHNERRVADGRAALPVESRLLDAMTAGYPPSAGVAVGWDRLVMLALGLNDVRDVMSFPVGEA